MKGQLFVSVFSVILIVLFGVFGYLMTIVEPPPLPVETGKRRLDIDGEEYILNPWPRYRNPEYGLEKIPEGVDADEFRQHLDTVTKYNDRIPYEGGQLVVPPIWPDDSVIEGNALREKHEISNSKDIKVSRPVKGLRRSVNDNKVIESNEYPGSILLKIINDSEQKKLKIKLISREQTNTKMSTKYRSSNNLRSLTANETVEANKTRNTTNYEVLQINAFDEIILNILDDSDTNSLRGIKNTNNMQVLVMNFTNSDNLNKNSFNETAVNELEDAEDKLKKDVVNKEQIISNILLGGSTTAGLSILTPSNYSTDTRILVKQLESLNDTGVTNEIQIFTSLSTNPQLEV